MGDKTLKFGLIADDEASAKLDRMGQAAEHAGGKLREAGESGHRFGGRMNELGEKTDEAATRASTAYGAFGALQSGVDLARLKAVKHAEALQAQADQLQAVADQAKQRADDFAAAEQEKVAALQKTADAAKQQVATTKGAEAEKLHQLQRRAEADGKVTKAERAQIDQAKESARVTVKAEQDKADAAQARVDKAQQQADQLIKAQQATAAAAQAQADAAAKQAAAAQEAATKETGLTTTLMAAGLAFDALSGVTDLATLAFKANSVASTVAAGATKAWSVATYVLGGAFRFAMGPIGLVVIAAAGLTAGIIYAYRHSERFRTIVTGAFEAVKSAAVGAWNWIRSNWPYLIGVLIGPFGLAAAWIYKHWDQVVGFVRGLPGRISGAARGMWDGIKEAFRSAINWIIGAWNRLQFTIPDFTLPFPPHTHFGGFTLGVPPIQPLAKGGITTGPMLAVVGDNPSGREAVIPLDSDMPLGAVQLVLDGRVIHQALLRIKRDNGGASLGLA